MGVDAVVAAGALLAEIAPAEPETEPESEPEPEPLPEPEPEPAAASADEPEPPPPRPAEPELPPAPERLAPRPEPPQVDMATFRSPAVRRLAAEHGLELGGAEGTGFGGRVSKRDVERELEARAERAAVPH